MEIYTSNYTKDEIDESVRLGLASVNKEDKMTVVTNSSGTSLTAAVGNYYRFTYNVGTLAITLPTPTGSNAQSILFFLTTGASPAVTFTSTGNTIYKNDDFTIDALTTYEIKALWNGGTWVINAVKYLTRSKYVDLGLPSGLLWAIGNIVKDTNGNYSIGEETDYGCYFSWGNIEGHNDGDGYDFGTHPSGPYASTPGASVNTDISPTDADHDAALACLGAPWHLPTKENFKELYDNTDREWTTIDGINGYKFMKKTDHSVYVFFPASGGFNGTTLNSLEEFGNYWSASFYSATYAYFLSFGSSSMNPQFSYYRSRGYPVRAVTNTPLSTDLKSFDTFIHNYENFKAGKNDLLIFGRYNTGYIDADGNIHNDASYNCKYGYSICFPGERYKYSGGISGDAAPGAIWFDKDWNKISIDYGNSFTATAPENACYVLFASFGGNRLNPPQTANFNICLDIPEDDSVIDIVCIGDSVTEGMATTGAHYARYGESPYPARLTTLLIDNGYTNTLVKNYGHGGERLQDMAVRLGAWPTIINQDITLPADGSEVSLGTYSLDSYGRVSGTKLELLKKDQHGDDYLVYLTQTSHDTNPITVNGKSLTMTIHDSANYLKQAESDSPLVIKAGSVLFTANNRNADVVIIYIGINGSGSINLETWLEINKRCGEMNGGKYIILGCTHSLFNSWSDVQGSTLDEKHAYYSRKCTDTFGLHFIDLYQDFFDRGYEILEEYSMLDRFTETQKQEIYNDLNQRIVPAELSYDNAHEGNVHLNKEGYQIIAVLVFERLKELNYIE